jgi:NADH:ubiquinone oxidoreductase subunit E
MGGHDTKSRFYTHWGPAETYGERREESALRRSGRPVADHAYNHFQAIDLVAVEEILERRDYDPRELLPLLEDVQAAYGYLPVAAIKHISHVTGAAYALVYGTASYYSHLTFEKRGGRVIAVCRCTGCLLAGSGRIANAIGDSLGVRLGGPAAGGLSLEQLPAHIPGAASPLVTVDGKPAPEVTETSAAAWSRSLAKKNVA